MTVIARGAVAGNDLPTPGEVRICSVRLVAPGDPAFAGEIEVVRASDYEGTVEAGAALYAALRDGHSLGDEAVHDAMVLWEALNLTTTGGQ